MCTTPHFSEDKIRSFFIKALNKVLSEKDSVIADMEILKTTVADINGSESERAGVEVEINMLAEKVQALID